VDAVWQMIREVITSTEDVRWAPLCPPVHSTPFARPP
jgi:hypothetical protein